MIKRIMLLVLALASNWACAHGVKLSVPDHPKWKKECGSCHVAYPPQFLTAGNWQQLMNGLDKHFGENALLDSQDKKDISDFLTRYAATGAKHSAPSLRIGDTAWFRREHHEVSAKAWSSPAIRSRANCTACHVNAERGDWSERGIRMPAGLREEEDDDDD
jgi:hypothetical protein